MMDALKNYSASSDEEELSLKSHEGDLKCERSSSGEQGRGRETLAEVSSAPVFHTRSPQRHEERELGSQWDKAPHRNDEGKVELSARSSSRSEEKKSSSYRDRSPHQDRSPKRGKETSFGSYRDSSPPRRSEERREGSRRGSHQTRTRRPSYGSGYHRPRIRSGSPDNRHRRKSPPHYHSHHRRRSRSPSPQYHRRSPERHHRLSGNRNDRGPPSHQESSTTEQKDTEQPPTASDYKVKEEEKPVCKEASQPQAPQVPTLASGTPSTACDEALLTPEQKLERALAAAQALAPKLPSYMNPGAMNPLKFQTLRDKRKLLWSKKKEGPSRNQWESVSFGGDSGEQAQSKFRRLMGMGASVKDSLGSDENESQKEIRAKTLKQLEEQYDASRYTTHVAKGAGLGYGSGSLLSGPKSSQSDELPS